MTRNEWQNLTPERLDACGPEWMGTLLVRKCANRLNLCQSGVSEWLIKHHGRDVQTATRPEIHEAATKAAADGCLYAPIVLRLLDRTDAIRASRGI